MLPEGAGVGAGREVSERGMKGERPSQKVRGGRKGLQEERPEQSIKTAARRPGFGSRRQSPGGQGQLAAR